MHHIDKTVSYNGSNYKMIDDINLRHKCIILTKLYHVMNVILKLLIISI